MGKRSHRRHGLLELLQSLCDGLARRPVGHTTCETEGIEASALQINEMGSAAVRAATWSTRIVGARVAENRRYRVAPRLSEHHYTATSGMDECLRVGVRSPTEGYQRVGQNHAVGLELLSGAGAQTIITLSALSVDADATNTRSAACWGATMLRRTRSESCHIPIGDGDVRTATVPVAPKLSALCLAVPNSANFSVCATGNPRDAFTTDRLRRAAGR